MASSTAALVMALKVTRWTSVSFSAFFLFRTSRTCQLIASPSRSGSVARMTRSARLAASAISDRRLDALASTSQTMAKSSSGRTEPSLDGRSRMWP
ncbi:hypothetical protein D3C72_1148610 [compost metagenome]